MFAKKIALLSEDLLWTQNFFKGYPATEMTKAFPGMEEFAEHLGMEVVYKKALKYKAGMYSPILEEIYRAGADCCVFVASPGNDTDVFAKQWADSSARNMHLSMTAGCGSRFWERTGGKCVGVVYGWGQVPLLTGDHIEIPDINTVAKEHNLILDAAVMFSAYPDIFFIKKA
ncbi:MAG: hypothetical protein M0P57_14855, partial [Syntrophales bacterium]|nr:hypothetical protein [Syntrophales bacterium]